MAAATRAMAKGRSQRMINLLLPPSPHLPHLSVCTSRLVSHQCSRSCLSRFFTLSSATNSSPLPGLPWCFSRNALHGVGFSPSSQSRAMSTDAEPDLTSKMAQDIIDHNRFVLSRVITMIESNREEHRQKASEILDVALKVMKQRNYRNPARSSIRLGISGPPGVGKSTFIEALGIELVQKGHRVAVIAVDPSSQISRGSILGDKTRMNDLAAHPNAYIRPCATGGSLGGLSQHTDEVVLLCETAGFDVILIETVGVGQSEVLVSEVADMFILLLPPVGGDELQGIKRGIMEAADLIVINKADGDLKLLAKKAQSECRSALQFLRGGAGHKWWKSDVLTCSAQTKEGVNDIMSSIETYWKLGDESGDLRLRRGKQRASWMWRKSKEDIVKMLEDCELVTKRAEELEVELRQSEKTPRWAARELVKVFMKTGKDL